MEFSQVAAYMWPLWLLGLFMIFTAWKTDNKNLLRVEKEPLKKVVSFLFFLTVYRILIFHFFKNTSFVQTAIESAHTIPWQMTFLVFWEDLTFALPLVFLNRLIGSNKYLKPIYWLGFLAMMLSFSSGHIYQGWLLALATSFYIPFSVTRGQMYGFGTIVLCHMFYDMSMLLAVRLALGMQMAEKKSPYGHFSVEDVQAAEFNTFIIQIGFEVFNEGDYYAFSKERTDHFYDMILVGLRDIIKNGTQEEKEETLLALYNFRVIPLRIH